MKKLDPFFKADKFFRITVGVFFVIYGFLGLLVIALGFSNNFFSSPRYSLSGTVTTLSQSHIYQHAPSEQITVDQKLVAAKTNLQRKVLQVGPDKTTTEVAALAEQYNAVIINQHSDTVVVEVDKDQSQLLEKELQEAGVIQQIEVDYPVFISSEASFDWGVARIEAPEVWPITTADNILIAVIDTGIDYTHPDLFSRYAGGYNILTNTTDPFDDHGHGTHVAGIIAADLNNSGITGVSPKANIYAIKALSADGTGYISDVVEAVNKAIERNVTVINFSLGTTYNSSVLDAKIKEAAQAGIFMVGAAGNTNGGSLLYPAAYGSVVAVAATDQNDNFASFSSLGAELAAPGVSVNSTVPGGGYARWSGTSMAAPHVSATAALMIANQQENIREGLRDSAIDLGPSGKDVYFGYGLVHAKPAALGLDVLAPIITFISPEHLSEVKETVLIELNVQDESLLSRVSLFLNGEEKKNWQDPEELLNETFSYQWDTTTVSDGNYIWIAEAVDEYDNQAEAKLELKVNQELEPTITEEPTPTIDPTETRDTGQIPARERIEQDPAKDVRRDIYQEPAQERRQDQDRVPQQLPTQVPAPPIQPERAQPSQEEARSTRTQPEIPPVTNINQRNPRSSEPAQKESSPQTTPENSSSQRPIEDKVPERVEDRIPEQAQERGRVRGVMNKNWWTILFGWLGN